MCGIAGIVGLNLRLANREMQLACMMKVLSHRGPDDSGKYIDDQIALGHRRLSIIDPEHGKQPMISDCGRFTIVFNGVIYNHLEIRRELLSKGHPLHSYSDTEVILYSFREWGPECVHRFVGMFAFAIWDNACKFLFCARDRMGIKPFYYRFDGERLVFASEIKAILSVETSAPSVNADGLKDYLTFQFCLGNKTLFKDIFKLEPGHSLTAYFIGDRLKIKICSFWDLRFDIDEEHDQPWFVDHLLRLIEDATRIHLRSDVPIGAHLSGGLDSSSIVCLVARMLKGEKLKTFCGAFQEGPQFDETIYAKEVAEFVGTEHYEIYVPGYEFAYILPRLLYFMDEPAAGPGLVPQYYVSRLASQHVKVVLGGQGGDEIFIGYARYLVAYLERCLFGAIYESTDRSRYVVTLESIIPNLPLLKTYTPMLQSFWSEGLFDSVDRRYFRLIDRSGSMNEFFSTDLVQTDYSPFEAYQNIFNRDGLHSLINRITYFDLKGQLQALLHVEDRMSMAASIESRVPLIDHRIVEFMASIPPNIKFSGGRMKHLFKEAVKTLVPPAILARKDKMGFPVPFVQWAKGVAREFVLDTLLSVRARQRGIYDMDALKRLVVNEKEFGRVVWGLLCLELWHRIFIDGDLKARFE